MILFMINGGSPILTLHISIKKYCTFLWWMEIDLPILVNSSNEAILKFLMPFHGDYLSGGLILLCGTSTLKGNN